MKQDFVKIFSDGASRGNPGIAGAGFIIIDAQGNEIAVGRHFLGEATNNVAEWSALNFALKKAIELGIKNVECFMDSKLVAEQASGNYKVKNPNLQKVFIEFYNMRHSFSKATFKHIPREQNKIADRLANEAIDFN